MSRDWIELGHGCQVVKCVAWWIGIGISASVCDYRWEIVRRGHLNPVSLTMAHPKSYPGSSGTDMCHFFSSHIAFHTDRSCERTRTPSRFSAPSLHKTHLHTRTNNAARPRHAFLQRSSPISFHSTCMTHVPRTYNGRAEATTRTSGLRVASDENSIFPSSNLSDHFYPNAILMTR